MNQVSQILLKPNESLEGVLSKITQNELKPLIINSEGANYEVDIIVITKKKSKNFNL